VQRISRHELVYVTATLTYRATTVEIPDVLVDTGAASTVLNADLAADAGIYLEATDQLRRLRGVGGHEHVFLRRVDRFDDSDAEVISRLRVFGEVRGVDQLTTPNWECDETTGWEMTALAAHVLGASGVYRAPMKRHLYWFMLLSNWRSGAN
jgi:hypothetical protein